MPDVVIIGGGVIGLSIAWELTGHGLSVRVLERGGIGQEASWAGAGMLPPGNLKQAQTSEARLRGAAHQLWPKWSEALTSFSGLDNQFVRCGGLEVCFDASNSEYRTGLAGLRSEGVAIDSDDLAEIRKSFPQIGADVAAGYWLPEFCQVRNPRHVKTLQIACAMRGVELVAGSPVHRIETDGERIVAVHAGMERHQAAEFVVAGGSWSGQLLEQVGVHLAIEPLKGQIVLLKCTPLPFRSVIQAGREYLVPRLDGRILIGSTEEHAGFDKRSTAQAVSDLIQFAQRVVPSLREAEVERCWAGLRPYSGIGRPYIGRLPQFRNGSVAAGHFRYGLHLSPITAVLMRQVLLGQKIDLPGECQVPSGGSTSGPI
ncbi:glycine oxidase ThiO [Schlesneria paludicola]|uniref:glycine oxidase ThiO n=1 Tax=Schlesneria paludicola TaxID=360056 RepID=UPI00029B1E51|nr:glycine oxidase ThiO [Schlesneria paludicola]